MSNAIVRTKEELRKGNRVALYVRVSTDDQQTSVENQQDLYTDYIKDRGWVLQYPPYVDEGISGTKSEKRLEFLRMVKDGLEGKYDILIAKSYSRFARNQRESLQAIADLRQAGVRIIFKEDNLDSEVDFGKFGLFGWLAEQEARTGSERIKEVWKSFDRQGKIHAVKPPYGYVYDKELKNYVIDREQAKVVMNIFKMYLSGAGCWNIARQLNEDGVPTQKGGKWANATITGMLKNHTYIGCLVQGKSETIDVTMKKSKKKSIEEWVIHQDNHEAIIAPTIFWKVQEEMKKRSNQVKENGRPVRHSSSALFSTLVKCKCCGTTCTVKRQKHFRDYSPYYACIRYEQVGKRGCGHERVSIFEDTLLQIIQGEVKRLIDTEYKVIRDVFRKVKDTRKPKTKRSNLKVIEETIEEKAKLSMTLLESYSKGIITPQLYEMQTKMVGAEIEKLTKEKAEIEAELNTFDVKIDKEQEIIDAINKLASVEPSEWTNAMLKAVIRKITVDNKRNVEVYLNYQLDDKTPVSVVNTGADEISATLDNDYQEQQSGHLLTSEVGSNDNQGAILLYEVCGVVTMPYGRRGQALEANTIPTLRVYL